MIRREADPTFWVVWRIETKEEQAEIFKELVQLQAIKNWEIVSIHLQPKLA